jgi:hypothetical protein
MRLLVTGATGQIGNEIIKYLKSNGYSVATLGRKPSDKTTPHFFWSLGMSPNAEALIGIDCILHLAWVTKDRTTQNYHLNVGGSTKIFEAAEFSGIPVVNFSSFAAITPVSNYGIAKLQTERANSAGINIRIAKIERLNTVQKPKRSMKKLYKFLLVPAPVGLSIHVIDVQVFLNEINGLIKGKYNRGTYTLPHVEYPIKDYLKRYHDIKSFDAPQFIFDCFFRLCKVTKLRQGLVIHDRWVSLLSTNREV